QIEARLETLSELYYEGRSLYDKGFKDESEIQLWERNLADWKKRVESQLRKGFSISELHKFRHLGGGWHYTSESIPHDLANKHIRVLSIYTSHLQNLDEIVTFSSTDFDAAIKYAFENYQSEKT